MGARVFLELLARDASAVEFEEPVLAARAAGADAAALAEIEEAKLIALRVRALLRRGPGARPNCPRCSTRRATRPGCATWTPCRRPSCAGPGGCWAPTPPT
ncbi:hypothetical protein [Streptosporangium sp. NPDC006007]|uniref:hypothetical protein n=1 Tax=Streptosporangium sp. NPDC006007 TaxID=3154575 RepID=UPI00339F75B1